KNKNSKISIQWASSAKEVQENNQASLYGTELNPSTLQAIDKSGKMQLHIPSNAQYLRIVVWSKGEGEPDLLTNWVDVEPNKTYTLNADHLVPAVLISGAGC